jgi:hypothetical protein
VLLGEIPVKERSSVLHTKEKIFSSWNELISGKSGIPYPLSAQHIRIRDGKVRLLYFVMLLVIRYLIFSVLIGRFPVWPA